LTCIAPALDHIARKGSAGPGLPLPIGCATIAPMSTLTSLFLAASDPLACPDRVAVEQVLRELALIGRGLAPGRYAAGEGFARHVVFAGCSPHLVMEPPPNGSRQFCHVALHGPFDTPRLVTGPNTVKPRCPGCRARFADWREQLATWRLGGAARCERCGENWPAHALDWRQHAISARLLVELRNVFPGEASPGDLLMQRLAEATGQPWRYAWAGYLDD
jgi:hypothetical protein